MVAEWKMADNLPYASFWQRAGALAIDFIILAVPLYLLALALSNNFDRNITEQPQPPIALYRFCSVVICWLYFAYSESSAHQATLGKRCFKIYTATVNGRRLSFANSSVRYFAKVISIAFFGLGCLAALVTRRKQAFHDLPVPTVVLRKQ